MAKRGISPRTRARPGTGKAGPPESSAACRLDRLIHEPVRLGIVSALAVNTSLSFRDLKDLLNTTDGNLSVHARKLEEAAYITCTKHLEGRATKTQFTITPLGRRALEDYLDHMDALIRATRNAP